MEGRLPTNSSIDASLVVGKPEAIYQLLKNLSTVSTSAPAARMQVKSNMLMPGHLRYGDLEGAAGAADAGELWDLLGRFEVCSSP
jgi:hypothetical protein